MTLFFPVNALTILFRPKPGKSRPGKAFTGIIGSMMKARQVPEAIDVLFLNYMLRLKSQIHKSPGF